MSITVNDQLNRTVTITSLADGIVSLVPSQTELLFDLGLENLITGVTRFCIHPEKARRNCTVVGGTKNPDLSTIESLKPGLILANKEENNRSDIEYLSARFPVWVSDVNDLDSALAMISSVGKITQTDAKASELIASIRSAFGALENRTPTPALYVIWNDPVLAAGSDTFINDMMKRAGFTNVIADQRYPEIRPETLQPEVVLLSSEPFPFAEKHLSKFKEMFPCASILLADGTYFSWYGSLLCDAPAYFRSLQHTLLQNRVHTA